MISHSSPAASERRAAFLRWFERLEPVERRQARVLKWLEGQEAAIPVLDRRELPGDFLARLSAAFGAKCPFCERPLSGLDEACHTFYRPPHNATQARGAPSDSPDCYKWLRWDGRNIYFACIACADAKESIFPVAAPRARRGGGDQALRDERPLLLDPCDPTINPLLHLDFDENEGLVKPRQLKGEPSPWGKETIDALALNRGDLVGARKKAALELRSRWALLVQADDVTRKSRIAAELPALREACADDAPFAGLHRQLLWRWAQANRLSRAREWQAFQVELAQWNGDELAAEPPQPQAEELERLRAELVRLFGDHAAALPSRTRKRHEQKAAQLRQSIAQLKEALRRRGEPVDDLPVDDLVLGQAVSHHILHGVDVLLVTVTAVEARAVLEAAKGFAGAPPKLRHISDEAYYYLGVIGDARVVMVQSEMGTGGSGGATLTINDWLMRLKPRAVIMVGIAFGVDESRQQIGDILVASELLCYDLQRVGTDGAGDAAIILRGARPRVDRTMLNRLRAVVNSWSGAKVDIGLILSGDKLVDNIDYRKQLQTSAEEAIGGEMEGAGLYAAAERHNVDWILIKAICDWADGKKHVEKAKRQQLAAGNAAAFTMHLLQQGGFALAASKGS